MSIQRSSLGARSLQTVFIAVLIGVSANAQTKIDRNAFRFPSHIPQPADNKSTPERVELGKVLFFDPRLSGSRTMSCATCHNPALGWADALPIAIGHEVSHMPRATPTLVNSAFHTLQMWDGRFRSLEEQALSPMEGVAEMNGNIDEVLSRLNSIPGYVELFGKADAGQGHRQLRTHDCLEWVALRRLGTGK